MSAHDDWKERVMDENKVIVVDGLNHVCMIATDVEEVRLHLPHLKKSFHHIRIYQEVSLDAILVKKFESCIDGADFDKSIADGEVTYDSQITQCMWVGYKLGVGDE